MTSATTFISVDEDGYIYTGVLGSSAVQRMHLQDGGTYRVSNIVKATNGYYYIVMVQKDAVSGQDGVFLLRSMDIICPFL